MRYVIYFMIGLGFTASVPEDRPNREWAVLFWPALATHMIVEEVRGR